MKVRRIARHREEPQRRRGNVMRTIIIAACLCVTMLGHCFAQSSAAAMTRIETQIPPQGLGSALKKLAEIRHLQVLFLAADVKGLRTTGASGKLTAGQTLSRLLSGTRLTYRYVDANAVSIVSVKSTENASKGSTISKPTDPAHVRKTSSSDTSADPDPDP